MLMEVTIVGLNPQTNGGTIGTNNYLEHMIFPIIKMSLLTLKLKGG